MKTRVVTFAFLLFATASAALAQPQPPPPAPRPAAPAATPSPKPTPPPAKPPSQPEAPKPSINIKVDVSITDQKPAVGASAPESVKKTVSVVSANGYNGQIRSSAVYNTMEVPLNVDVGPSLLPNGRIQLHVNLAYGLPAPARADAERAAADRFVGNLQRSSIQENLTLILEDGKPITIAQSADPVGDRQVTVEVKATILK